MPYGLALVAVTFVTAIRYALGPLLGAAAPLLVFVLPTVAVAMYGGTAPALFTTALGAMVGSYFFIEPTGGLLPVELADQVRLALFLVENLAIIGVVAAYRRARTALVTASQNAQTSARLLGAIVDTTPHAIIVTDPFGAVTAWNTAATRIFGWSAAEVIGKPLPQLLEESHARVAVTRARILNGERLTNVPVTYERKDGGRVECQLSMTPLHEPDDRPVGILATLVDVSGQKALEEQLRQSQKMEAVGELAAGIAHDFNNKLTSIIGYADLAAMGLDHDDDRRRDLEAVRKAAQSAAGLTHQLLAFSRRQVLEVRPIDVAAAIRHNAEMLARTVRGDVVIDVHTPEAPLWINADLTQLDHILLNLVVNARDAMPMGGVVRIDAGTVHLDPIAEARIEAAAGEHVFISVTDAGEGMTREVQARIFEPFFTTKQAGKGTGLGLAMVYGAVRQMGGSIRVYSEPGRGTTFKMYFPRVDAGGAALEGRLSPLVLSGSETVLVTDDDDAIRSLAARTLTQAGYTVLPAATPEAALQIARAHRKPIDLLISDVVMPGMHGPELAQILIGNYGLKRVLYTSGYTDQLQLREQIERGDVHFLAKPFTPAELNLSVRYALDGLTMPT